MNWTIQTVFVACLTLVSGDSLDRAAKNLSFSNILSNYFNKSPVFKKKRNVPFVAKDNLGVRRIFPYDFVPPDSSVNQEKIKSDNNIKIIQNDETPSSFNINNLRSSNIITSGNLIKFRNDPSKNNLYYKESASASNMVQNLRDQFVTRVNVPDRSLVVDRKRKNFAWSVGAPSLGNDLKVMSSI